MYANEVETKVKKKLPEIKKLTTTLTLRSFYNLSKKFFHLMKIKPCTECFCFPCTLDTRYSQEVQESTALNNKIHLIHLAWNFRKIISCSNKVGWGGGGGHNPLYGCDSELVMTELNAYNKIRVQSAYVGCGVELEL